jgi:hypothetical protein
MFSSGFMECLVYAAAGTDAIAMVMSFLGTLPALSTDGGRAGPGRGLDLGG